MELVASSTPGAVEEHRAWRLLRQRVVLTTTVCRELQRTGGDGPYHRADAALGLLYGWIAQHGMAGEFVAPDDGIEDMVIPEGAGALDLVDELWAGTGVCRAFAMLQTADTRSEYEGDQRRIRRLLADHPY